MKCKVCGSPQGRKEYHDGLCPLCETFERRQENDHLVFVYGTLLTGFGNHNRYLNGSSGYLGPAVTRNRFAMYCNGCFPYVFETGTGGTNIRGEIFVVCNETLGRLDRLEGVPRHYDRIKTPLMMLNSGEELLANIYIAQDASYISRCKEVESGDWAVFTRLKA